MPDLSPLPLNLTILSHHRQRQQYDDQFSNAGHTVRNGSKGSHEVGLKVFRSDRCRGRSGAILRPVSPDPTALSLQLQPPIRFWIAIYLDISHESGLRCIFIEGPVPPDCCWRILRTSVNTRSPLSKRCESPTPPQHKYDAI